MQSKLLKVMILIILLFTGGSLIIFTGFSKGINMAGALSRPAGAQGWTIPNEMVAACTYTSVIIGTAFILLAMALAAALLIKWINSDEQGE